MFNMQRPTLMTSRNPTHSELVVENWDIVVAKEVELVYVPGKRPTATISVNSGQIRHEFGPESRVTHSLLDTAVSQVQDRLVGGKFFVVNDRLIDFRDNRYNGFVHTMNNIEEMIERIGVSVANNRGFGNTTQQQDIALRSNWGSAELEVPQLGKGGDFTSNIYYQWSPFMSHIRGVMELVRLICTNGMIGTTYFYNARIPIINRWEEHLDIAYKQIQNKIAEFVTNRLIEMSRERATVGELMLLTDHALERSIQSESTGEQERLNRIIAKSDPRVQLSSYYRDSVFEDKQAAACLIGHLTVLDLYNMATEISSHTAGTSNSTTGGLQRLANTLMFDGEKRKRRISNSVHVSTLLSPFSNAEQAFFGEVGVM